MLKETLLARTFPTQTDGGQHLSSQNQWIWWKFDENFQVLRCKTSQCLDLISTYGLPDFVHNTFLPTPLFEVWINVALNKESVKKSCSCNISGCNNSRKTSRTHGRAFDSHELFCPVLHTHIFLKVWIWPWSGSIFRWSSLWPWGSTQSSKALSGTIGLSLI